MDHNKRSPLLFIQARNDAWAPVQQTEEMVRKLRANGVPTAVLPLESEPRTRAPNELKRALEAELSFYARVMGVSLAEPLEPVVLEPGLSEPARR
jgi:dipeptidyl aminopeptidase/acylaminoacyl peptidase